MERPVKPISSTSIFLAERSRVAAVFQKPRAQNRFLPSSAIIGEQKTKQKVRMGLTPVISSKHSPQVPAVVPEQEIWTKRDSRRFEEVLSALIGPSKYHMKSPKKTSEKNKKKEIMGLIAGREKSVVQTEPQVTRLEELLSRWDLPKKYLLIRQHPPTHRPDIYSKFSSLSLKDDRKLLYDLCPEVHFGLPDPTRKEEMVSIKEAMRNREWLSRCKEVIVKEFNSQILHSFAISVEPMTAGPQSAFRVYVAAGNNSQLVKKLFASRWWWTRVDESEKSSAHLLWTQWKDKEWFAGADQSGHSTYRSLSPSSAPLTESPLRYSPYNSGHLQSLTGRVVDVSPLSFDLITKAQSYVQLETSFVLRPGRLKTQNKLEGNQHLANKKALFFNLKKYYECVGRDPFEVLPLTFHVRDGENDPEFERFEEAYRLLSSLNDQIPDPSKRSKLVWILKPGENTNRGTGITLCSTVESVKAEIRAASTGPNPKRTFIIQKYLEKPLLVNRRKFDIRLYSLVVSANGLLQGYFYREGYIRTSSKEFSLLNLSNKLVHLTNDAVQKHADDYGKFEMANKLSYSDLQRYLETHRGKQVSFCGEIVPRMRDIVKDSIEAVFLKLNPHHRTYSFEVSLLRSSATTSCSTIS